MATLLLSILSVLIGMMPASAAPLFLQDFHLHDFDAQIIHVLGHDRANVAYFSELASVTENEASVRRKYEPLGCYPFYVMKDGTVQEAGYNCGTFSCTGLIHGPKQCIDRNGAAFGGVSDITSGWAACQSPIPNSDSTLSRCRIGRPRCSLESTNSPPQHATPSTSCTSMWS